MHSGVRPAPVLAGSNHRSRGQNQLLHYSCNYPASPAVISIVAARRPQTGSGMLRHSRSLRILGCFLPSFLTVRNQRPGEKTILSANYHNYSIMAILDEFLMKCALVSSGFHNFQAQPLHSSHLLHKGFSSSPANQRSRSGEDGPSRNFACQNSINCIC